jgi:predicted nucleotidyltransferase
MYIIGIVSLSDDPVTTVADARSGLSRALREFRLQPQSRAIILGSHRRAEAALVPIAQYEALSQVRASAEPVFATLQRKRELILKLAALNHLRAVSVFGSVALGSERATSDVDLLVEPSDEASLFDLAQFGADIELLLDRSVDVVSVKAIDPTSVVGRQILAQAVPL